jgi:AbrB family looped-hinge helix DNA binding protein
MILSMKNKKVELLLKVGSKGQIVLRKKLREALGIREGSIVKVSLENKKIIIEPIEWDKELNEINEIANEVSKYWPKGLSAVEAMREDRE